MYWVYIGYTVKKLSINNYIFFYRLRNIMSESCVRTWTSKVVSGLSGCLSLAHSDMQTLIANLEYFIKGIIILYSTKLCMSLLVLYLSKIMIVMIIVYTYIMADMSFECKLLQSELNSVNFMKEDLCDCTSQRTKSRMFTELDAYFEKDSVVS